MYNSASRVAEYVTIASLMSSEVLVSHIPWRHGERGAGSEDGSAWVSAPVPSRAVELYDVSQGPVGLRQAHATR